MLNKENRKLKKGKCSFCKKVIFKRDVHLKLHEKNYCSVNCQSNSKKTGSWFTCSFCKKPIYRTKSLIERSKSKRFFCSKACAASYNNREYKTGENHPNFKNGKGSYRNKAFRELGEVCSRCGYNRCRAALEVHHKDGDRTNNKSDNLEIICRNCHSEKHYM